MDKLAVFKGKNIRRTLRNNEWWFSVVDIVEVLTDSADPKQYIKRLRSRDNELSNNWGTICTPVELVSKDGCAALPFGKSLQMNGATEE